VSPASVQALCYAKLGDRNAAMTWAKRAADGGNHSWFRLGEAYSLICL
jgi:hypothetical protein